MWEKEEIVNKKFKLLISNLKFKMNKFNQWLQYLFKIITKMGRVLVIQLRIKIMKIRICNN